MIDVTHYHYYGSALYALAVVVTVVDKTLLNRNDYFFLYLCAQLLRNERCGVEIDYLIYCAHLAKLHELFDYLGSGNFKSRSKLGNHYLVGNKHLELLLSRALQLQSAELFRLGLALVGVLLVLSLLGLLGKLLLFGEIVFLSASAA